MRKISGLLISILAISLLPLLQAGTAIAAGDPFPDVSAGSVNAQAIEY